MGESRSGSVGWSSGVTSSSWTHGDTGGHTVSGSGVPSTLVGVSGFSALGFLTAVRMRSFLGGGITGSFFFSTCSSVTGSTFSGPGFSSSATGPDFSSTCSVFSSTGSGFSSTGPGSSATGSGFSSTGSITSSSPGFVGSSSTGGFSSTATSGAMGGFSGNWISGILRT